MNGLLDIACPGHLWSPVPRARVALAAIAVLLAGCHRDQSPSEAGESGKRADRPDVARILLFTQDAPAKSVGERAGWNWPQLAAAALADLAAREQLPFEPHQVSEEDVSDAVRRCAGAGGGLIVLLGEGYLPKLEVQPQSLPNVRLVCVGASRSEPGVESVRLRLEQGAYLCGLLAGFKSRSRRGAVIADRHTVAAEDCIVAFGNGARAAATRTVTSSTYVRELTEAGVRTAVTVAVGAGADMIFQDTSMPGETLAAVADVPNVFVFGTYQDRGPLDPRLVIASVLVDAPAVFAGLLERARRRDWPTVVEHTLADGVIRLVANPALSDWVGAEAWSAVERAAGAIKTGQLDVLAAPPAIESAAPSASRPGSPIPPQPDRDPPTTPPKGEP